MRAGCRLGLVGWCLWGGPGSCSPVRGPGLIPRHLQSGCPPDVPLRVGSPLSLAAQPPLPSLLPGLPWDYSQGCGARRRLPACSQERRSHWGGGCHLTQRVACWVFRQVRCQRGVQEPPGLTAPAFVQEAPRVRPETAAGPPFCPHSTLRPAARAATHFPCRAQCADVCYTRASWFIKKASMGKHPVVAEGPLTRFPGCCGWAVCETRTSGHTGAARPAQRARSPGEAAAPVHVGHAGRTLPFG